MPAEPTQLRWAAQELGRRVFELRRRRQLTQEALSELSGVSRNQIQNIEHNRNNTKDPVTGRTGHGNPRLDTIYHLAAALEVPPSVLIDPDSALP